MSERKKLIEVSMPLDAINAASVREKSIRHGHPSTLHLWWARRPLAAARAVLFGQLVDDPSACPDEFPTEEARMKERERLHGIIEELVKWENTTNETVLEKARNEIRKSWKRHCKIHGGDPEKLPAFHDPFAGGGAIPLEAQRLGLEAHASDLNPVAVMINKAMIEIPPKFADQAPVNPESKKEKEIHGWPGTKGLASDVRYYGNWMREQAEKRIGHLYPKVKITEDMVRERSDLKIYGGEERTVIAWIWARTVKSPNPAFRDVDVPLMSTFILSTKKNKECWMEPVVAGTSYSFRIRKETPPKDAKSGTKQGRGSHFKCLLSGVPIEPDYVKQEGKAGRMGQRLVAVVCDGDRERIYVEGSTEMESIALSAEPTWEPEQELNYDPRAIWTPAYGLTHYKHLFTKRQLLALTTFSDLVQEAREQILSDAKSAGLDDDCIPYHQGGIGITAYADAVAVYLGFVVDKCADYWSNICSWHSSRDLIRNTFGRQAIPMVWDYSEANPFCGSTGNWRAMLNWTWKTLLMFPATSSGQAVTDDAASQVISRGKVVSTDPPYYDNIGYGDLSDFFYIWLRRSIRQTYPNIFATMTVPKAEELVATPYRHGNRDNAEKFFMTGMTGAMKQLVDLTVPGIPVSIYYAFKQSETKDGEHGSTGWETFLQAVIHAAFSITGTWPLRTEMRNRMIGSGTNALASSIVMVCRKRPQDAPVTTRRDFQKLLRQEMPDALVRLQQANIAPVDLQQSAIGPGMAVFSRFTKVLEADGSAMTVRTAMSLINDVLDELTSGIVAESDTDTKWAVAWFEEYGFKTGDFGMAESLCKSKGTSLDGLVYAGIAEGKSGKVRLLKREELDPDWDPRTDKRLTLWETAQHLIRILEHQGEGPAAELVRELGGMAEQAKELAIRLYLICQQKEWAEDALSYNGLVTAWPQLKSIKTGTTPDSRALY